MRSSHRIQLTAAQLDAIHRMSRYKAGSRAHPRAYPKPVRIIRSMNPDAVIVVMSGLVTKRVYTGGRVESL